MLSEGMGVPGKGRSEGKRRRDARGGVRACYAVCGAAIADLDSLCRVPKLLTQSMLRCLPTVRMLAMR
eukprot:2121510-Rhodomonas_salina.5